MVSSTFNTFPELTIIYARQIPPAVNRAELLVSINMSTTPNKIIYSMVGVGKMYDKKAVLKDIYLSYFYGAKIGVLGLNGSGKSSLLKILAGIDKEFIGETHVSP